MLNLEGSGWLAGRWIIDVNCAGAVDVTGGYAGDLLDVAVSALLRREMLQVQDVCLVIAGGVAGDETAEDVAGDVVVPVAVGVGCAGCGD